MDVEIFLSIFGILVLFSLLYSLAFLRPKFQKTYAQIETDTPSGYSTLLLRFSQLGLAAVLFTQAMGSLQAVNPVLVILILAMFLYDCLF